MLSASPHRPQPLDTPGVAVLRRVAQRRADSASSSRSLLGSRTSEIFRPATTYNHEAMAPALAVDANSTSTT